MRIINHTPLVVGIDLGGSKMDMALFLDEVMWVKHYVGVGNNRGEKLASVVTQASELVWGALDYIFIEEPIVGRGVRASLQLSQMLGCWWGALGAVDLGDRVQLVPVTTWKKEIVGKAFAKKEEVANWLQANHPSYYDLCDGNQDLIDATCIGLYGQRVVSDARSLELTSSTEQPDEPGAG